MEPQIWVKSEEKWAYILTLRGPEVHELKITGNMLTLKRNIKNALEGLQQGRPPAEVGGKVVATLDARQIAKAEVSPGNGSLTLKGEGEKAPSLTFATADDNADQILQAILAQSGRTYQPTQEEIGVIEALMPPALIAVFGGLIWSAVYFSAVDMDAGKEVTVKGGSRRGLQRMAIFAAGMLGTKGTMAVGVALLLFVIGWAAMRIVRRPQRTVWLPATA